MVQQPAKDHPRKKGTPSAAGQPFLPDANHPVPESLQRQTVARDPEAAIPRTKESGGLYPKNQPGMGVSAKG